MVNWSSRAIQPYLYGGLYFQGFIGLFYSLIQFKEKY
jgi:hypothetical protein